MQIISSTGIVFPLSRQNDDDQILHNRVGDLDI